MNIGTVASRLLKPFRFRLLRIFAQSLAECCMKLVEAIVKPFKLDEIKEALTNTIVRE